MPPKSKYISNAKTFQKLLVYEPILDPRKSEKTPTYPSAPSFGTTIKVCTFKEMEGMCRPRLCDCPPKETPLCPNQITNQRICLVIKLIGAASLFAFLFDSGIFRHPIYTTRMRLELVEKLEETFSTKGSGETSGRTTYDRAIRTYNLANVWNAAVCALCDLIIASFHDFPDMVIEKVNGWMESGEQANAEKKEEH